MALIKSWASLCCVRSKVNKTGQFAHLVLQWTWLLCLHCSLCPSYPMSPFLPGPAAGCWNHQAEEKKTGEIRLSTSNNWNLYAMKTTKFRHYKLGKKVTNPHLSNFTEAAGVNRSALSADRHYVPALVLGLATTAPRGVRPTTAPSTLTGVFLRQQLLLYFDMLSMFFHLCFFMDLIDGFGTQISSSGHPVVLCDRKKIQLKEWRYK